MKPFIPYNFEMIMDDAVYDSIEKSRGKIYISIVLEKPDEEDVTLKWNEMMDKSNAAAKMQEATQQLQDGKDKLEAFNSKVEKPEDRPVEIIQEDDGVIPHIDLVGQKKTEDKEIEALFSLYGTN